MSVVTIPISFFASETVYAGAVFTFNEYLANARKSVTRVYRIMTVNRIAGTVTCVVESETQVRT